MVNLNKIYTRTGDSGSTGLVGGARIDKDAIKVEAYGDVDELNSQLGLCKELLSGPTTSLISDIITTIQNELFDIGAELATPAEAHWEGMLKAGPEHIKQLELWIDTLNEALPPLRSFILPGGSLISAQIHVARTVCRRAERHICKLHKIEPVSLHILGYINRLSDLLFVMARAVVRAENKPEYLWVPGASRPARATPGV
ncbi:MAG: cob(I)yrinic acid a,c-diamide adenosyltransferase [Pseudomonadota bacterium]|jgi:cob(I)alamin adenosyltransferase